MLTDTDLKALICGAAELGVTLPDNAVARFERLAERLEEANRSLNLTRVPPDQFVLLHFLDSLALSAAVTPAPGSRLLDVGSGAGFPGLPIAIAYPEVDVTLLDGTRKRLDFIDSVITELQIENARTLHGRAEDLARQSSHRGSYDIVTARAVAKMDRLACWLLPLVRPDGVAVAYKSRDVEQEMVEAEPVIQRLGAAVQQMTEVPLPQSDIVRNLVVLRKRPPEAGQAARQRRSLR